MKKLVVTIVLLCVSCSFGASPRAVEAYGITSYLVGGPYCDCITASPTGCFAGAGAVGRWTVVDSNWEPIRQSGIKVGMCDVTSAGVPGQNGRILPCKTVNFGCIPRKEASSIPTNKHGNAYGAMYIGAFLTVGATTLCDPVQGISTRGECKIKLLGRSDISPVGYRVDYWGNPCPPENSACLAKANGYSYILGGVACASESITVSTFGVGVLMMSEEDPPEEPVPDPNRLPQAQQPWPGEDWHRLELDGTWNTTNIYLLCKDPNESMIDLLSCTEAWVYCEVIDSTMSRLARIMQGVAVGMNKCADGYMSDYLFFSANSADTGRYADNWGNPCVVLHLTDGQTIEPNLPDANVPDVLNRWLEQGTTSDLNADGTVDGKDFAMSANQYGLQ